MKVIAIRVFAKVNLYLRVLGRRSDGFHDIRTIMHPIGLSDEISVREEGADLRIESDASGVPLGAENTVAKAWRALERRLGKAPGGCVVSIRKGIPMQAGLGGASADAAGALLAWDRLFGLGLTNEALREVGAEAGSDVPFFLGEGPAEATGRGEIIRPLKGALDCELTLALIRPGVSTPEAYGWFRDEHFESDDGDADAAALEQAIASGNCEAAAIRFFNSFESVVFPHRADILAAKKALTEAGASGATMTGSGSTVFALGNVSEGERIRVDGRQMAYTRLWAQAHRWL